MSPSSQSGIGSAGKEPRRSSALSGVDDNGYSNALIHKHPGQPR